MNPRKLRAVPILSAPSGEVIPKWDTNKLENRNCIVCGSNEYKVICYRPDSLEVGQCTNCFTLYLPIVPDEEQLREFYCSYAKTKAYMQEQPAIFRDSLFSDSMRLLRKLLRDTSVGLRLRKMMLRRRPVVISEICELLIRTGGIEGKRILEVGPGKTVGILPDIAFWGGRGIAIEIDPVSSKAISDRGFRVFSDISEITSKVDVIYASMVLEHLKDPALFMRKFAGACVQGGRLIVRVPNAGQANQLGGNWIGFRVDLEHLNYFDQRSLNTLLFQSGFNSECVWLSAQPILPEYLGMADRNRFLAFARGVLGKRVKCSLDILTGSGNFTLSVLARKDV
jgi:hypothetical protein